MYACTHMHKTYVIALGQLLLQDKWRNTVSKLYVKGPRRQIQNTDTSLWNFHAGIVCYDLSEEFLYIKT